LKKTSYIKTHHRLDPSGMDIQHHMSMNIQIRKSTYN